MPSENPKTFDKLAAMFATGAASQTSDYSTLEFGVAANIDVAWRVVGELIAVESKRCNRKLRIMDFGCGAGGFSSELARAGHSVEGIDVSQEMIAKASQIHPVGVNYAVGNEDTLGERHGYDVVCMNLVTNYISDLTSLAGKTATALVPGGKVVFSELFPEYVRRCAMNGVTYTGIEPTDQPKTAILNFPTSDKTPVKIWLRSPIDHEEVFGQHGFELRVLCYPKLPSDFFDRTYKQPIPEHYPRPYPRYQILMFEKMH